MSIRTESNPRLFFALPLPGALVRRPAAWRDELAIAGHLVAPGDLHLALEFLGNQPHGSLELLRHIAAELRGQPFGLCLDRLSCWRSGLLHLAPRQMRTAHPTGISNRFWAAMRAQGGKSPL